MELIITFKDTKSFYRKRYGYCDIRKGVVTPRYYSVKYGGCSSAECYRKGSGSKIYFLI
jgi:hypothetical protein